MKQILLLVLLTNISAYASYFVEECSNAGATVRMISGHTQNKVVITDQTTNRPFSLGIRSLDIFTEKETKLDSSSKKTCFKGSRSGYISWTHTRAKKITITNKDGSEFSPSIVGVSSDQKSITAFLICKNSGNSRTACEEN